MRIAFISDIHGNYPALMKVLEDAAANNVEKFIFVGDYIFDLPFSNEVAYALMGLENAFIIKGNKEMRLKDFASEDQANWTYDQIGAVYQTIRELKPGVYEFLNGLDDELHVPLNDGVSAYAVHVPPKFFFPWPKKIGLGSASFHKRMLEEPFTHKHFLSYFSDVVNSDEYKLGFGQIDADIVVFGHNHLQSYAYCGNKLIINPGSCGLALDFNNSAAYTIVEIISSGFNVGFNVIERRVEYDVEAVINQTKQSEIYNKGRIYSELNFLAMRTGRDYFGFFFEIAREIASSKGETGHLFSNETWAEANDVFTKKWMVN